MGQKACGIPESFVRNKNYTGMESITARVIGARVLYTRNGS